jgi:hypothetical protein
MILIQAAFHHEQSRPQPVFADGSRVQTLTHSLSFASVRSPHLCMVDEESRWSLLARRCWRALPGSASAVKCSTTLVDRMVRTLARMGCQVAGAHAGRCRPSPKSSRPRPPMRRMGSGSPEMQKIVARTRRRACNVQLIGIPLAELQPP